ncbi:MAG: N-acetylmuramoyl-L-alanine amidase [Trueperaceae bacterium]
MSPAVMLRRMIATLLFVLAASAWAQPTLIVNGRTIAGATTTLVSGSSYAPGAAFARALGASFHVDGLRSQVTLQAGGRILQLAVADSGAAAATPAALRLDGRVLGTSAAVVHESEIYLPVKPVAEALGASVTFLPEQASVLVVQPRAVLGAMRHETGRTERLELSVSAPVHYAAFWNEPVGTLQVHLERTDVGERLPPQEGTAFTFASASAAGGGTDVRIQIEPGYAYEIYAVPDGRGFRLVVAFGRSGEAVATRDAVVVLDPGHGGADAGIAMPSFGSEGALTLAFADRLAALLRARGIEVRSTRDTDHDVPLERRSAAGVGADLFLSLHVAELPVGAFRAYYLDDAGDVHGLDVAVRANAAAALRSDDGGATDATDTLRRRLLLGLVTDLDLGRRMAEALAGQLFGQAGYRADEVAGAPLQVLGGAAGRGLLIEFSAADLASDGLPERLADALLEVLRQVAPAGGALP